MEKLSPQTKKQKEEVEEKGGNRHRLIIASGNSMIVFHPTVTTQRVSTLLLRKASDIDKREIRNAAKKLGIEVVEVLYFWFDERREPPLSPT